MTRRIKSKHKISRRLGANLWGQAKSPVNLKAYGPGMHGQKRKKISDYGMQLRAKQKLKASYGEITEKQFRKTYKEAIRLKGDTGENLIGLLERRLDSVVYRMKLAPTIFAARQLVNHGHCYINGHKVNIPSCLVKAGDEIALKESSQNIELFSEAMSAADRDIPAYIKSEGAKGVFIRIPQLEDVPYATQMEPNLVVEFYSR